MQKSLFFLIVFICANAHTMAAQNLLYAQTIVQNLCSNEQAGRGYVRRGHQKAARYIAQEYRHLRLEKVGSSYYQKFKMTANTFARTPHLSIDDKVLVPGVDFLLQPNSGSGKGSFDLTHIYFMPDSVGNMQAAIATHVAVLLWATTAAQHDQAAAATMLAQPAYPCAAVLSTKEKLTWSVAQTAAKKPLFYIKKSVLDTTKIAQKVRYDVRNKLKTQTNRNITAMVRGTQYPDSFILITAHYDHLGMMGKTTLFCGANDNAGGVAMMLTLAQYFAQNPQPYSIGFVAFAAEEAGLIGSKHWVENPPISLKKIKMVLNLDLVTTGENGITIVNATNQPAAFEQIKAINTQKYQLPKVAKRNNAPNSDHYPFTQKGVPAIFIYAEGNWQHYHDVNDCPPVTFSKYNELFGIFKDFIVGF